ncbi:hypothetical protein AB0940_33600 [Streptomyces sp. NPDC006656]|uniref:hypothetical protein n=1 Tax=Streptomyces sp. NPDC006656 TaxID=3156899 RepID=UPI00345274C5
MTEQTTTAPRPQAVPVTWAPSQTGPCARCHRPTARYGAPANPLCEACRSKRRAQYGV